MLGWSIPLFRIAGIPLALHWSLLLLYGYVAWRGYQVAGVAGLSWMTVYFALLFGCVVLHELGHCFAARRFGVWVGRILLLPIGGMAEFGSIPRRPAHEMTIAIAGPLVNFALIALLFVAGVSFPADWEMAELPLTLAELGRRLVLINFIMGCFNLIPAFPMDGGRVFRAALAARLPYLRATWYAATLGKLIAAAGAALMLLVVDHWLGAALFVFIFVAGEAEYRAVKRREAEEERWRQLLDRFYLASHSSR
jgi:Zn-dependent protease